MQTFQKQEEGAAYSEAEEDPSGAFISEFSKDLDEYLKQCDPKLEISSEEKLEAAQEWASVVKNAKIKEQRKNSNSKTEV